MRKSLKNKHLLSLAGNGVMSVLGVVTLSLLYRALPAEDTGKWLFFMSMLLLVDTFRSGFITTAFIKYAAGASSERVAEITGATWFIAGTITAGMLVLNGAGWLFAGLIENESIIMFLKWFGITYTATLPYYIASCVVQAEQRFDWLLYIRLVNQGLFILLVIALIVLDAASLQYFVYAYITAGVVTSLFALLTGWARINTFRLRTPKAIREMYHFGKFSVGTTLSANMFRTSDTFLITFLLGPAALAVFNLGQRLMEIVEIPLRSFVATAMPELSAAYNRGNKKEVIHTMKKYIGMLTLGLLPVVLVSLLGADLAILVLGGEEYVDSEAANVLRIFMLFALLYPMDRFMALTLDVINRPKVNFIKVVVMLAGNVTAGFLGITLLGNVYGVAFGNLIPILIAIAVAYRVLVKFYPFKIVDIFYSGVIGLHHLWNKFRKRSDNN